VELMNLFLVREWKADKEWNKKVRRKASKELPEEVPMKIFKPKCENLEILEEYGEEMSDSYWDKWEKRQYKGRSGGVSWVDAGKLKEEAERVGVKDMRWVDGVCDRLEKGAVLRCRGEGR
jgi:hypothetical protein